MHKSDWFAGLSIAVALLGCGDDDSSSGPSTSSAAASCARGCTAASAAKCPNQPANCQQQCEASIESTPAACLSYVNQYAECTRAAVWSCDQTGLAQASSCQAILNAWNACASGTPAGRDAGGTLPMTITDAGKPATTDAGTLPTSNDAGPQPSTDAGTGRDAGSFVFADASVPIEVFSCQPAPQLDTPCDSCLKANCCDAITACNGECDDVLDCTDKCGEDDEVCLSACFERFPDGYLGVLLIDNCGSTTCAASCPQTATNGLMQR